MGTAPQPLQVRIKLRVYNCFDIYRMGLFVLITFHMIENQPQQKDAEETSSRLEHGGMVVVRLSAIHHHHLHVRPAQLHVQAKSA